MSKTLVLHALDCYSEDLTLHGKNKQYAVGFIKYLKEDR